MLPLQTAHFHFTPYFPLSPPAAGSSSPMRLSLEFSAVAPSGLRFRPIAPSTISAALTFTLLCEISPSTQRTTGRTEHQAPIIILQVEPQRRRGRRQTKKSGNLRINRLCSCRFVSWCRGVIDLQVGGLSFRVSLSNFTVFRFVSL